MTKPTNTVDPQAPAAEEVQATRTSWLPASIEIGRRDVTVPPDILTKILGPDGAPVADTDLFPFLGRPSNSLPDMYFTYMPLETLQTYAEEGTDGISLMVSHDTWEMPVGRSYKAWVEEDAVTTPEERSAAIAARGGVRYLLPPVADEALAWLYINYYMQRGLNVGMKPNDELIKGILSGTIKEMSIGFIADVFRCNICKLDMYSWDWDNYCPHIPGVSYDLGPDGEVLCLARVEGGHLLETSLVYKGATPGANIVEVKARMVASAGRLTTREVRQLAALEARLGRRFVDPAHYRRAVSKTVIVPARAVPDATDTTQAATTQSKKEKGMASKTNTSSASNLRTSGAGRREPVADPAATDSTLTTLEGAVADLATAEATSLADRISAVTAQITASEDAIRGLDEQLAAANAADPVDSALVSSLQTQLDAENANLAALQTELDALNAELTEVNVVAEGVGGTPADAAATATGADGGTMAARARSVAALTRAFGQRYLAPLRGSLRTLTQDEAQPVIDSLNELITMVQALIQETGANSARAAGDAVIINAVARAAGVHPDSLGFAQVRSVLMHSDAGKLYMTDLQDRCVKAKIRAVGASAVNEELYRRMLSRMSAEDLEAEEQLNEEAARQAFTPGRRVLPAHGSGSVDLPEYGEDQEPETPATAGERKQSRKRRVV